MPTVLSNVTISGNQTSSGLIVPATYSATVLSGGTAVGTTVEGYGALFVSSGGYASGTVVGSGGVEQVSAGGVASGSVVSLGGQEAVGGTALGTVVSGTQTVLAGGSAFGTVVSNGSELVDSGGVTSNAYLGGQVGGSYLAGQEAVSSGGLAVSTTVSADGDLEVGSGGTALGAVVSGSEDVYGYASGSVISGGIEAVYGGGTAYATVIAASGTLDLTEDASAAQDGVTFAGADGELIVGVVGESSPTPTTPVSGFAATDRIDLMGVTYTSANTASFADGALTVSAGGQAYTLDLPDLPSGTAFALEPDSGGGTLVLASDIPCFAAGTRIRTKAGDIAVEDLRVGDRVVTQDGRLRPITWIGHRHIRPDRHPRPWQVRPVRIEAHAFGPNQPRAALSLSPDHAILAEGVLIPIKHLINGMTVRQVETDSVTYFHVELPEHDVILAEGLPAESYLDTGDRLSFANGAVTDLHPAFGSAREDVTLTMDALGFAPLRIVGPEVERVRARLAARVGDMGIQEPLRQAPA